MSAHHGTASLDVTVIDATHAKAVFQGRNDLTLRADACELQATRTEVAMTCPRGVDGVRVEVTGLSQGDVVLAHLGEDGGVLTSATPSGTIHTSVTVSSFPGVIVPLLLLAAAVFLARPRVVTLPRAGLAYALGGVGVWLLLVRLTGS